MLDWAVVVIEMEAQLVVASRARGGAEANVTCLPYLGGDKSVSEKFRPLVSPSALSAKRVAEMHTIYEQPYSLSSSSE